jgi:hypothetical protein
MVDTHLRPALKWFVISEIHVIWIVDLATDRTVNDRDR